MVFSSAFFLFIFFPVVFVLYRCMPGIKAKNFLLTAASLFFYAAGEIKYFPLLLFTVTVNYLAGRWMANDSKYRRLYLIGAVVINLTLLGTFKYLGFVTENLSALLRVNINPISLDLPIGISFFIFQSLSYTIDVYRDKKAATYNFGKLLLYISFFPQLIAGPIIIYHDVAEQIDNRDCTTQKTAEGLRRFVIGLAKKLLLANTLGKLADSVYALPLDALDKRAAWLGAVCYSLQIYFDFSGYSDMAIGLGKCFGFSFLENFNYPFIASSIRDFWRRWHISLSSWFRDYLYIPLGGNRKGAQRRAINQCIVFFCTGLWHGAAWTFVIWGLWHGFFIILENIVESILPAQKWRALFGRIYTMLVVLLGFVVFRADNFPQAWAMFSSLFGGFTQNAASGEVIARALMGYNLFIFAAALLAAIGVLPMLRRLCENKWPRQTAVLDAGAYFMMIPLLLLCVMNLASSTFNPFIYFRF
jgi:alginate O-acetyltransferase complex protein AlgI